ncbi:MAG: DUF6015 family protein [Candidatus Thermoplasmatota archaeon]
MSRITLDEMKEAIEIVFEENDIDQYRAEDMAETVMNLFGYDKAITDNLLSSEERDIFYKLEDVGLLSTEEESTNLPSGKKWRIHYWILNERKIRKILDRKEKEEENEEESIYNDISDKVWERTAE